MGYEHGDAQNSAVRCFLNQFSKNFDYFNDYYKNKTLEYFDYKCPYTGVLLTSSNMVRDHIVPLNKKSCGLHLFGNVLLVDRTANSVKSSKSLEEYLRNQPERLEKIQKFIKVTGYLEIQEKYQQYLHETCSKLYDDIGSVIKNNYEEFQENHLKNKTKKQILMLKKTTTSPKSDFITKVNLSRQDIKNICNSNGYNVNVTFNIASKNATQDVYWVNPNVDSLKEDWTLVLNDNINKTLYCFDIPANSIHYSLIKMKNQKEIDLQINYRDLNFTDKRSGLLFKKWLVKTINY